MVDAVVLLAEALIAVVAVLGTAGVMSAPVLFAMQTTEVTLAAVKASVLGLVPLAWHFILGIAFCACSRGRAGDGGSSTP